MEMSKPCKIHEWGCIYHACMSDDCQKKVVAKEDPAFIKEYGPGKCEEKRNPEQCPDLCCGIYAT
jgi:hypothetical protein